MNPSQQQADALRQAANAVEAAAKANDVAAEAQAEAITANAEAQRSLEKANADIPTAPVVTKPYNFDFDGGKGGNGGASVSNGPAANGLTGIQIAIWGVALMLLIIFIFAWIGWLTASKADNQRVDQLHAVVASANATANIADIKANENQKAIAAATSTINTVAGKVDSAASKADEALRKAQAALDAKHTHMHTHVKSRKHPTDARPFPKEEIIEGPSPRKVPSKSVGIWEWHDPNATATNKKACIIASGSGLGLPEYCSNFTVQAAKPGEDINTWRVRVGGGGNPTSTGLYTKPD